MGEIWVKPNDFNERHKCCSIDDNLSYLVKFWPYATENWMKCCQITLTKRNGTNSKYSLKGGANFLKEAPKIPPSEIWSYKWWMSHFERSNPNKTTFFFYLFYFSFNFFLKFISSSFSPTSFSDWRIRFCFFLGVFALRLVVGIRIPVTVFPGRALTRFLIDEYEFQTENFLLWLEFSLPINLALLKFQYPVELIVYRFSVLVLDSLLWLWILLSVTV